jgi:hypothetical protein
MSSGATKEIRDAAGRGLMASAMRQLEKGAALEIDDRRAKAARRSRRKPSYETASAALAAMRSGAITLGEASKVAKRIESELAALKKGIVRATRRRPSTAVRR